MFKPVKQQWVEARRRFRPDASLCWKLAVYMYVVSSLDQPACWTKASIFSNLVPETAISNTISSSSTHVTEVRASSLAAASSSSDRKSLLSHVESYLASPEESVYIDQLAGIILIGSWSKLQQSETRWAFRFQEFQVCSFWRVFLRWCEADQTKPCARRRGRTVGNACCSSMHGIKTYLYSN
jgi:hypothetical protein